MNVNFGEIANSEAASQALNSNVIAILNENDIERKTDNKEQLGFTSEEVFTKDGVITSFVGATPTGEIGEGAKMTKKTTTQLPEKGYKIKRYGDEFTVTSTLLAWLEKSKKVNGADPSVQKEYRELMTNVRNLVAGKKLRMNNERARVFIKGFDKDQSYGPGSPLANGQALISTAQPIARTGGTFSNKIDGELSYNNLVEAINIHTYKIKLNNAQPTIMPDFYTLYVSRKNRKTAGDILNAAGAKPMMTQRDGTTVNTINTWVMKDFAVRLEVIDQFGSGAPEDDLGTGDEWFVVNTPLNKENDYLMEWVLQHPIVETRYDYKTKDWNSSIHFEFAADSYGAFGIVGGRPV